ncbi:hypothetical protein [Alloactinosynnema sp. L-07]|nr:hypothetical protein [Alloactinosynnema sp. L-07]
MRGGGRLGHTHPSFPVLGLPGAVNLIVHGSFVGADPHHRSGTTWAPRGTAIGTVSSNG